MGFGTEQASREPEIKLPVQWQGVEPPPRCAAVDPNRAAHCERVGPTTKRAGRRECSQPVTSADIKPFATMEASLYVEIDGRGGTSGDHSLEDDRDFPA